MIFQYIPRLKLPLNFLLRIYQSGISTASNALCLSVAEHPSGLTVSQVFWLKPRIFLKLSFEIAYFLRLFANFINTKKKKKNSTEI